MDALINPATGDYLADPLRPGALTRDPANGLLNAAYLRLMTPLGSWFGDVTVGSRLHELLRDKDVARSERLAQQYALAALQPLLDDGRALSIEIRTARDLNGTKGQLAMTVELVDANGVRSTFAVPVAVA